MNTPPAEDNGDRKKRFAPWSPDELNRDKKKKGDGTSGYDCAVVRNRDMIPEGTGIPKASPTFLKPRKIIKVRRTNEEGGITYSLIRLKNGFSIPFFEKPVTTLSILTEPGADLEEGFDTLLVHQRDTPVFSCSRE